MKRRSRLPYYAAFLAALASSSASGAQIPRRVVLAGSYCFPKPLPKEFQSTGLQVLDKTCVNNRSVRREVQTLRNALQAEPPDWVVYIERRGNAFYNYLNVSRQNPTISGVAPPLWDLFFSSHFSSSTMAETLWESFVDGFRPIDEFCRRHGCRTAILLPDEPQTTAQLMSWIFSRGRSSGILLTLLSPNLSVNLRGPVSRSSVAVFPRELDEERIGQQILDIVSP